MFIFSQCKHDRYPITTFQVVLEAVHSLPEGGKVSIDRVGVRRGQCGEWLEIL